MQLVGVGWYVAASIIFGLLGGLWIDGKLGTLPVFTLLGVILGTVAAFYGVYKMMVPLLKQDKG
ncbi:MAG: AtpZ/AtpI family protein [Chloroflexi bacterium]|nr:AtpZ/AtpI family protein [Chloroflexota bacterium]